MFFCPKCDNMYSITKTPPVIQQYGGDISDTPTTLSSSDKSDKSDKFELLIQKLLRKEKIENVDVETIQLIFKSHTYKKLTGTDKEYIYNKLMEFVPVNEKKNFVDVTSGKSSNVAFFVCKNCAFFEPIENGTLITSRISANESREYTDYTNYKNLTHIKTLPLTRHYVCPNDKCASHKDNNKREAVFYRLDGTYRVRYICKECYSSWI